ncbi:uncharacterized protein HMPREF1541_09085, partial [Cyphellophora europaea CBS 101466]
IPGGLKPMNTTTGPKSSESTRSRYFSDHRGSIAAPTKAFTASTDSYGNEHTHPNKRLKLDTSATQQSPAASLARSKTPTPNREGRSKSYAISLDDSHDGNTPLQFRHHEKSLQSREVHGSIESILDDPHMSAGNARHPRSSHTLDDGAVNFGARNIKRSLRESSNGPLTHARAYAGISEGDEGAYFLQQSKRQRKTTSTHSDEAPETLQDKPNRPTKRQPGSPALTARFFGAKHVDVPSSSPDALQEDEPDLPHRPIKPPTPLRSDLQRLTPNTRLADKILGNSDSSKLVRPKAKKYLRAPPEAFALKEILAHGLINTPDYYEFWVDPEKKDFYIMPRHSRLQNESLMTPRDVSSICQAYHSDTTGLLHLKFRGSLDKVSDAYTLRLESDKSAYDLLKALQKIQEIDDVVLKEDHWMERLFEKRARAIDEMDTSGTAHQHKPSESTDISHHFKRSDNPIRRQRTTDHRDLPRSQAKHASPTVITGAERSGQSVSRPETRTQNLRRVVDSDNRHELEPDATEELVEQPATSRTTRASRRAAPPKPRTPSPPKIKFSKTGGLGTPWENALVYPPSGKKRETVDFGSLERLDDDEFLNDTLIGFFLRYLQYQVEQTRPELMKKMHFFNSYFFDNLTKGARSRKDINYQSVSKWTKAVDLFTRDFVIVPMNEHLHWFVAIICNLPHLKRTADDGGHEDNGAEDSLATAGGPGSDGTNQATNETQKSFEELSIEDKEPQFGSHSTSPLNRSGKKGKKRKRQSLPKYNLKSPVIISLDSLGQPRSQSCSFLKQYIVQEGKNKHGLDIDDKKIPAMTAKEIPTQGNFSDCGLYVCMYLEQFMRDPDGFVRAVLQRGSLLWPKPIHSNELRSRLRALILELHREQEGEEARKLIPELGSIMVDMRIAEPEVIPNSPPAEKAESATRSDNAREGQTRPADETRKEKIDTPWMVPSRTTNEVRPATPAALKRRHEDVSGQHIEPNAILIEDDNESPPSVRSAKRHRRKSLDFANHKSPKELAAALRQARDSELAERQLRAASVNTDFMNSDAPYERAASNDRLSLPSWNSDHGEGQQGPFEGAKPDAREQSAEIPETQDEQLPEVEFQGASQGRAGSQEVII